MVVNEDYPVRSFKGSLSNIRRLAGLSLKRMVDLSKVRVSQPAAWVKG
jgi:hypothetical protein